jgi:hypothetical protein
MTDLVRQNPGGIFRRETGIEMNCERPAGVSVYKSTTSDGSPRFARRPSRRDSASKRLCEGVKGILRRREGLVISAHHSSSDHPLGCKR